MLVYYFEKLNTYPGGGYLLCTRVEIEVADQ